MSEEKDIIVEHFRQQLIESAIMMDFNKANILAWEMLRVLESDRMRVKELEAERTLVSDFKYE